MWPHSYKWLVCFVWFVQQPAHAACDVSEKALVGAWQSVNAQGFFEVFELHANHRFDSWLHDRPEMSGAMWQFKQCELTIADGTTFIFRYQVKLNRHQLLLKDIEQHNGVLGIYQRVKE